MGHSRPCRGAFYYLNMSQSASASSLANRHICTEADMHARTHIPARGRQGRKIQRQRTSVLCDGKANETKRMAGGHRVRMRGEEEEEVGDGET